MNIHSSLHGSTLLFLLGIYLGVEWLDPTIVYV